VSEISRRERKKSRTRDELIRAAVKLFQQRGFEATTVDDIVEAADYSRATFFRHFPAKEDVLFIDLPDRVDALERVRDVTADVDPWIAARAAVAEQVLGFTAFAPDIEAACVRLWFTEPALYRRYLELVARAEDHLTEFLDARLADGTGGVTPRVLAIALIGVGRAVLMSGLTDEADVRRALDEGFASIERGVLVHGVAAAASPRRSRARGRAGRAVAG
jgi:AcrR family transcriptional regulator